MVKDIMEFLAAQDPEIGAAVRSEYDRQRRNIELIASGWRRQSSTEMT